jgi:heat shock protein HslJ/pimeloyl-ACP methyl ester carboxylesterase
LAVAAALLVGTVLVWYFIDRRSYSSEDVFFHNADVRLAGTVVRPRQGGVLPGVVLIHGSGAEDRSSLLFYARMFARHGFAALIYDKRGVGGSGGDPESWRRFNFHELAGDAAAAVRFLRAREDVDAYGVGLFAVSQGCWVAPLAAVRTGHLAFMVQVSASVSTVAEDRLFERAARLRHEGFEEGEIEEAHQMQIVDQEVTRSGQQFDRFTELWDENAAKKWFPRVYTSEQPAPPNHEWREWYRTIIDFNPVPVLKEISVPSLWIFGDPARDRFAPVQSSIESLQALNESGKGNEIKVYQDTDHSLQPLRPGISALWDHRAVFEDDLFVWLGPLVGDSGGSRRMIGVFAYMADAGLFTDCLTGKQLPVTQEGDNALLERAYLSAAKEPAAPVLVTVAGTIVERPAIYGEGTRDFLTVERFLNAWPGESCESSTVETPLTNTYWKLVDIDGTPVENRAEQPEVHMLLEREDDQVRGFAGCNRFFGTHLVEGNRVGFGQLASTMTACPYLDEETALFAALEKVTEYEIMGESLELRGEGDTRLRFRAVYLE